MPGVPLPGGVRLVELEPNDDDRGSICEVFREEWGTGLLPVQWNAVRSDAEVLRGVHVHFRHAEYVALVHGHAALGLADLRTATEDDDAPRSCLIELRDEVPAAVLIPPGVAHGLYFRTPAVHLQATSHYYDADDVLGIRWDDPELRIPWPPMRPALSPRDGLARPLREARQALAAGRLA